MALAALLVGVWLPAAGWAQGPELRTPQWSADVVEEWLEREAPPSMHAEAAPWLRLDDGGVLLTAIPSGTQGFVVRRFDAGGRLLHRHIEYTGGMDVGPVAVTASMHATDAGGSLIVLRKSSGCRLLHLSSEGAVTARHDVLLGLPAEACDDVLVSSRGDIVIQGIRSVRAFAPDASVLWTYLPPPDGNFHAQLNRLREIDGTLWVTGVMQNSPFRHGAARVSLDGAHLSTTLLHCDDCGNLFVRDIAGLPDGRIAVAGHPSFVATMSSTGALESLSSAPDMPGIRAIASNPLGELYLQGESDPRRIARFDLATRQLAWYVDGVEAFTVTASGVAIVQRVWEEGSERSRARFLDGGGQVLRSLPIDVHGPAFAPWIVAHDDDVDAFVTLHEGHGASAPDCAEYPRVSRLHASGALPVAKACSRSVPAAVFSLVSDTVGNRFARTSSGVISFNASGRERWRHMPCAQCDGADERSSWHHLVADGRGGAWVQRERHGPQSSPRRVLTHLANDGRVDVEIPLDAIIDDVAPVRVLPSDRGIDVVSTSAMFAELVVTSFDPSGHSYFEQRAPIPDGRFVLLDALRRDDGTLFAVLRRDANQWCFPPYCAAMDTAVIRIAADGTHASTMSTISHGIHSLRPDGTLWSTDDGWGRVIERINPEGTVMSSPVDRPESDGAWLQRIYGPLSGRHVFLPAADVLQLVDADGNIAVTRLPDPYRFTYGDVSESDFGYLMTVWSPSLPADAELRDAQTLQIVARFDAQLPAQDAEFQSGPGMWSVSADGSVIAVENRLEESLAHDEAIGTRVFLFSVPGSLAASRVFADGLEH